VTKFVKSPLRTLLTGLLVIAPTYLAVLLLLKTMQSLIGLLGPVSKLFPESLPGAQFISLILFLIICFVVGLAIRTRVGKAIWRKLEKSLFQKLPGYSLLRDFTQRLAGETEGRAWKPALAEIEESLVPAFIIEQLDDGRLTVFVPSVPTPFAGAVYILTPDRVHPLTIPFADAIKVVSKWGAGSKDLFAAVERKKAA
jgi:uncharacterized membrane protein